MNTARVGAKEHTSKSRRKIADRAVIRQERCSREIADRAVIKHAHKQRD
jgi:hypothetical protein